jgi:propionate CoA-transferase
LAQADQKGNLNVSKFGPKLAGAGGFINISQNAKRAVFVGTFTAGGLKIAVNEGELRIIQEGKVKKFVEQVEHVTFSGEYALEKKQPVLYVTERCVLELTEAGMALVEVAPGVELKEHILDQMEFDPIIEGAPRLMDSRLLRLEPMGLRQELLTLKLEDRFTYDQTDNLFFVNLEGFSVSDYHTIEKIRDAVENILSPVGHKVFTIVNYDNFNILPEFVDEYTDMVKYLVDNYYSGVTRYTTSAFLRVKLGDAMQKRNVAPQIYASPQEAKKALRKS